MKFFQILEIVINLLIKVMSNGSHLHGVIVVKDTFKQNMYLEMPIRRGAKKIISK
jgi:hypothetical protein